MYFVDSKLATMASANWKWLFYVVKKRAITLCLRCASERTPYGGHEAVTLPLLLNPNKAWDTLH